MRILLTVALGAMLAGCSGNTGELESRVRSLEAENAALKAQLGAVAAQTQLGLERANAAAMTAAAESYARRCQMALEMTRVDDPNFALPEGLDGKSCNDPLLGENAVEPDVGIVNSTVTLVGTGYRIEVLDSNNAKHVKESE